METKTTTLSAEKFLTNLKTLKYKMRNPLPSDVVYYKCEDCSLKHPLNSNGILELENCLEHHIDTAINQILNYSLIKINMQFREVIKSFQSMGGGRTIYTRSLLD